VRFANLDGRLALATPDGYRDVATASDGRFGPDPMAALEQWPDLQAWASDQDLVGLSAQGREDRPVDSVPSPVDRLGPPVPSPRQVFAIGLNYRDHIEESRLALPQTPSVFTKFPTSVTGPGDAVALPPGSVDWEVELVVVVGRRCERVAEGAAWAHMAGVMVGQDLSERQLQLAGSPPQFSLGKSYPGFAPVGPELVTIDELPDPDDLALGCALEGGPVLQQGTTAKLVFSVPELVARLSAVCPLLPGDLIFTGTPGGVGGARTPPQFLSPGDVLLSWIDGVGRLRNPMTASPTGVELPDLTAAAT
jgi:2,4-didehydro-3-deoxy-L-rhamnonate hydrolase